MKSKLLSYLFLLSIISCTDTEADNTILNESDQYVICNSRLGNCTNGNGKYCLFGYKWGINAVFSPAGYNVKGPQEPSGEITFSFQESSGLVNTHAQVNLPSKSFSSLQDCAKTEIRNALNKWASHANIEFIERPENSLSDIRFFVADIRQSGVGFPNFQESPCDIVGGDVIIQSGLKFKECEEFYRFVLHEIGHTLGLGHVETQNIMNRKLSNTNVFDLQSGDIEGIIELYGMK